MPSGRWKGKYRIAGGGGNRRPTDARSGPPPSGAAKESDDETTSDEIFLFGQAFAGTSRYLVGVLLLIIADVIWMVADSFSKYIYNDDTFEKPMFTAYFRTSFLAVYLLGFVLPGWRSRCLGEAWLPVDDSEEPAQTSEHSYLLNHEHSPPIETPPSPPLDEVFEEEEEELELEEQRESDGQSYENGIENGIENGVLQTGESPAENGQIHPDASPSLSSRRPSNLPMNVPLTTVIQSESDLELSQEMLPTSNGIGSLSPSGFESSSPVWPQNEYSQSLPTSPTDGEVRDRMLAARQRRRLHRSLSHSPTSHPARKMRHSSSVASMTSLRSCLKNSPSSTSLVMPTPVPQFPSRRPSLTAPVFKPLHVQQEERDEEMVVPSPKSPKEKALLVRRDSKVRFSMSEEVRALPAEEFADANFARLSFQASEQRRKMAKQNAERLGIYTIFRLAGALMIFLAASHYFFDLASAKTSIATVNIFSSVSPLFFLIAAAAIPSCKVERFSATKLTLVAVSIASGVLVGISNSQESAAKFPKDKGPAWDIGIFYTLLSAALLAVFVVLLKRQTGPLHRISMPIFLGFLGLWCLLTLWPFLLIFHFSGVEKFVLPNKVENATHVWPYLVVKTFTGTFFAEIIWLLGLFMTSPLVGMLALALVNPLKLTYSLVLSEAKFSVEYVLGSIMAAIAFFLAAWLVKRGYPDPVGHCLCMCWRRELSSAWSERNALAHHWRRK